MMFGVIHSLWNNQYSGKCVNIFCKFVPQIIFLSCLFGYMSLLMFHKWAAYVRRTTRVLGVIIAVVS